jgi:membrane-associated phospholipid phosphatase
MNKLLLFFYSILLAVPSMAQLDTAKLSEDVGGHKKKPWVIPVVAAAYAGTTFLVYSQFDTKIKNLSQNNQSKMQTFVSKSVTDLGLGKTQTYGLLTASAIAFLTKDQKLKKTVFVWAGSLLLNGTITQELKVSFHRYRPSSGSPYNTFGWRNGGVVNTSFVSAHTSNIFTTATVFATNYKDVKWVPPVAYGIATLVGLSRIYDNAHWASDVMAGAAIGFASAKAVNALYNWVGKKILILPNVSRESASVSMVYQF